MGVQGDLVKGKCTGLGKAVPCSVAQACLTLQRPHGLLPARLLCPWDFPGKNTPGDLPDLGVEPVSLVLQVKSLPSEPSGKSQDIVILLLFELFI